MEIVQFDWRIQRRSCKCFPRIHRIRSHRISSHRSRKPIRKCYPYRLCPEYYYISFILNITIPVQQILFSKLSRDTPFIKVSFLPETPGISKLPRNFTCYFFSSFKVNQDSEVVSRESRGEREREVIRKKRNPYYCRDVRKILKA